MAYSYTSLILQRVVLPIILVLASLYRPVGISFVYLLMFFISPFVPVASARNFKRSVTPYLIILIALSSLLILCHISLQLVLLIFSMDDVFGNCSFTEQLLRHIGFVDLRNLKATSVIEWLVPEVVVFVASVVIYCVIKKLVLSPHDVNKLEKGEGDISSSTPQTLSDPSGASILERPKLTTTRLLPEDPDFDKLIRFSPLLCIASLFFAAVLRPSVPGSLYFIIFLYVGTYWATMRSLGRVFSMVLRFIMVVIVLQILLTVAYQTPWVQQHLDKNNLIARLIGLEALVTSTCKDDIRVITYDITNYTTASYLSPVVLCLAFYTLALSTKNIRKKPVSLRRERAEREKISDPTETTPLVRSLRKSNPPVQTGSINDQPISSANIDMENLSDSSEEKNEDAPHSSVCDQITYGFISIGGFIYQNSYIFTNILMMAWSIIYHSWLTFVFLLWANLLWMIPNQRKAMMRSSPFIVLYAECLLIAQYIYGMDLNSDELPTKVNGTGINLGQIGFSRPLVPCIPLLIKSSFLLMFWVTLRQYIKEKKLLTGESRFTLFTPLGMGSDSTQKITSTFLKKLGEIFKSLLVRLWIWLLVLIIFLCAITGRHMTGFRICYMALFLFFLLVFQSSSKAWIKIMYGFWLFLIFYVMTILILIYTYQFDKFDDYWRDYINIPEKLQLDIGLERYKTKDLFLHLLSPTLIVILTVIQVHYFHKRFIAALEHKAVDIETFRRPRECLPNEADLETYVLAKGSEHRIRNMIFYYFKRLKIQFIWLFKTSKGVVWRLLELHILKLVYFTAFICCVSEVCLLHIIFVLLCLLGVCSNTSVSTFISRIISLLVSIIVLTKMMYQVAYLDHNRYDTNCTSIHHGNTTVNDAEWFGLKKELPEEGGLMKLLRLYIAYMIVVTLHAVVILRQSRMRTLTDNEGIAVLNVLFPSVTRADAEKNLNNMIKYLCNYGFYKFGLEITMIWLVSTITFRQDIVAFLYVFWLIIFLLLKRKQIAKIWVVFLWFVAAMIILQYILFVGLPPSLCIIYPWDDKPYYEALQRWAMLPGCLHLSHISKLIFDFVLLMFVNSQLRVFKIHSYRTSSPTTPQYPGGTNRSAVSDIEKLGEVPFVNPTRDFLSNVRNYLDIFLNIVFSGFFWITLAVVFVGGTNIHNFFALGYLIGAFVFLWEGSDFYLRPIKTIIRRWKWLVGYNVANIAIKTFSQIGGCMFLGYLRTNTCWLVHVLGISCMARPFINSPQSELAIDCPDAKAQSSILWDAICFAFLIFQLRIFKSHYFCHMILDTRANSILTSRGGDLIEDLRRKQIEYRQKQEHEVLLKIKKKMEKIRATQQKMLRPILKPTHFDEHGNPVPASRPHKRKEPKLHAEAVRAGDYYMFEDMDDKFELDIIEDSKDFLEEQEQLTESEKKMNLRKTLFDVKRADSIGSLKKKDDETEASARPEEGKVDHASEERTETDNSRRIEIEKQPGKDEDYGANPVGRLLEGLMVSLILRLNRFSRNYRYVNKILAEEKRMLKESDFLSRISKPSAASLFNVFRAPHHVDSMNDDTVQLNPGTSQNDITQLTAITPPTETNGVHTQSHDDSSIQQQNPEQIAHADHDIIELPSDTADAGSEATSVVATQKPRYSFDDAEFAARDHHIVIEFIISLWYAILSNTDLLCYIVIFINQVSYASVLSLPLPTMVFLWGTLSLPRPTKTFWVTLIAYTQAIVLIKCIFQFKLIWAHYINIPNQPLTWEKILGVEERENYATVDLLVLLVLFFHRYILKSHGLWVSKEVDDEMFTADNNEVEEKDGKNKSDAYLATDESDFRDALSSQELTPENKTKDGTKYERPKGGMDQIQKVEDDDALSERSREKYIAGLQRLKRAKYFSSVRNFFYDLMNKARLPVDVYALMFLCDFINFFVLLFGFTSFSYRLSELDSGGVETYFSENKIPIPFLIMLLVQFLLIVIDRALYLRKALIPKIVFHYFSVIGVHIWMFFIVPYVTERSFHLLAAPIIFYICKCFYLLLSSYQIKCGFPRRILGNFFTKSFSVVNMVALKIFMLIPFLYELRTVLDWLCTSTTMTLFDWLKMEGIYSEIFFIRCTRQLEQDFPALRSEKKQLSGKLLLGGTVILLIFLFIWGPLCIFALGKTVGVSNIPYEATVTIRIGPYDPVYHTSNRESIFAFGAAEYANMSNAYKTNREAIGFLTGYDAADIAAVKLAGNSPSLWTISPPDKERLLTDLKSNNTLIARFIYALTRHDSKGNAKTASSEVIFKMNSTYDGREALIKMIEGDQTDQKVTIPNFVPKFIKVPNTADVSIVTVLMPAKMQYRNLIMGIHNEVPGNLWWEIKEDCSDEFHRDVLHELPLVNCDSGLVMYTFNEKSFPKTIIWLTGAGIVGVYTTFVLLASRVLKGIASNIHHKTMFQDLPYVDRVLQLCLDIYLVREALEFTLEEDLFAKLIFLYRSPETLIKWTRPVEERNEDETDTESVPSRSSSRPLSERRQNEQQQQQQPPH